MQAENGSRHAGNVVEVLAGPWHKYLAESKPSKRREQCSAMCEVQK